MIFAGLIGFLIIYLITPRIIIHFEKIGWAAHDINQKKIITRTGLPILIGMIISLMIVYSSYGSVESIVLITVSISAFIIGTVDDRKVMRGWFKPVTLIGSSIPLLFLSTEVSIFGLLIPAYYLIPIIIPLIGNTVNSIDVFNGVVSGVMIIAGVSLSILFIIQGNWEMFPFAVILFLVSLSFHRFRWRIFPGDSGALLLGAFYGGIIILGHVEVYGFIIIAPLIINSFLYLYSVKRITEHRNVITPIIKIDDKFQVNSNSKVITLVRLIINNKQLTQRQITNRILYLVMISSAISVSLAVMDSLSIWII